MPRANRHSGLRPALLVIDNIEVLADRALCPTQRDESWMIDQNAILASTENFAWRIVVVMIATTYRCLCVELADDRFGESVRYSQNVWSLHLPGSTLRPFHASTTYLSGKYVTSRAGGATCVCDSNA